MSGLQGRVAALEERLEQLEALRKFEADVQVGMTAALEADIDDLAVEVEELKKLLPKNS
jgi:hypothetical protein